MPLSFGPPAKGWPDFGPRKPSTYTAGPMRGYERFNFPAFDQTEKDLEPEWEVHSPANMDREEHGAEIEFLDPGEIDEGFMHHAMRRDIAKLLEVDAIHLMTGWEKSSGVAIELTVARAIGLEVYEQVDSGWVRRA